MLELLLGRAGCGKTAAILGRVAADGGVRRQLILVPEQASHETERRLCAAAGNAVSLYAEVLSFTRLSSRVFSQAGGLAAPTLDPGGRVLLMQAALKSVADHLTLYARPSRRPAFLTGLLATLDECKQYQVAPEDLARTGGELEGAEGEKLRDLGLIFGAYDALCARTALDPRDRLTRLAQGLEDCHYAQGMDVYVDGFTDFTPQEGLVLRALMAQAASVTVALTCDSLEGTDGVFAPARRTARRLLQWAEQERVQTRIRTCVPQQNWKVKPLARIEAGLFTDPVPVWPEPTDHVVLFQADSLRSEVEWTAARILELVREKDLRFRDIAVAARDFGPYAPLVEEVFPRYGIPLFLNHMTDILQKPVFAVLTAALDAVAGDYEYEDLFRYLKSGLAGLEPGQVDRLENYALKWDLRGSHWRSKNPWTMHPKGYGAAMTCVDQAELDELNRLRDRVMAPLERLRTQGEATGRGQAFSLYRFLEDIDLPGQLEARAARLQARGELRKAEEDRQLWDILCGGLEQCARILGETPMELGEFSQLWKLVLSQYDVGAIPVALDRVTAGEVQRLGNREIKALFFLGADDGSIPQTAPTAGLFTDDDRSLLASYGLELSPLLADKLDREWTIVYEACARPSHYLTVSWAAMGPQGEERRPSLLVERLRRMFPQNPLLREGTAGRFRLAAPRPALELAGQDPAAEAALRQLPEYAPRIERMERSARLDRGRLSPAAVEELYGRKVPMSASRMDRYKSCHFAYFMEYGLKARARERAEFQAPEYGTFVHYVLEHLLQDKELVRPGAVPPKETLEAAVEAVFRRYIREELGGLENKSARFVYLFDRLRRPVVQVVENVLEELAASDFRPIAFELGFGAKGELPPVELTVDGVTVSVSGFVDRVDGWVHDGRLYLRVVDYKTGRKSFDLTEVWNGLGLQMLLYLFTLEDQGKELYGCQVTPAGVLYLPAREAVVAGSRSMEESRRQKAVDEELRRKGLVLDEPQVLAAMERPGEEGIRFLPVRLSARSGAITGEALVTAQRLGKLKAHTQRILRQIGQELAGGVVTADPYWRGPDREACRYCDYAAACHFEEGRGGDCRRYLPSLDGEAFWQAVEWDEAQAPAP